jgi:hypothetical protein
MENPTTTQPATPNELEDERTEWITPAITDYDIEEATLSGVIGTGTDNTFYS